MHDRREFLRLGLGAALGVIALPASAWALTQPPKNMRRRITVYKSPECECCKKWVEHVKQTGWIIDVKDVDDMAKVKKDARIPAKLQSCHTAVVGRFVFEGHVPADLLLAFMKNPRGVAGLAVPGMPTGTPGMEIPGRAPEHYQVLGWYRDGRTFVYASL